MKLRVTLKELAELTQEQKQNLCDLWIPHIYDVAVANVCVDAAVEKYEQIIYVVGGIKISKHHDVQLYDMKFLPDNKIVLPEGGSGDSADENNDSTEGAQKTGNPEQDLDDLVSRISSYNENSDEPEDSLNDDFSEDFSFDEDFDFQFQRPESFNKEDCVPLLDIGQMIDILQRKNFGECAFSLSVSFDDNSLEIGKDNFSGDSYGTDSDNSELCDILWLSVKALL